MEVGDQDLSFICVCCGQGIHNFIWINDKLIGYVYFLFVVQQTKHANMQNQISQHYFDELLQRAVQMELLAQIFHSHILNQYSKIIHASNNYL
jgi:hypothetical protein